MKKTLLGTTALVSAGLIAGPALASDPLKVTVGGTVTAGFYVIDHDDFGPVSFNDTAVKLVARNIDINAEGTLDNGMVAGVLATLSLGDDWNASSTTFGNPINGNNNEVRMRELFAYLEGGFGRFEIGGTDGAAFKMHYTSPWFVPGNGVDSPNILNINDTSYFGFRHSTFSLMAADANKVTYFTPRFAGFQLGLSYTPETTFNGPNPNGLGVVSNNTSIEEVFEIALNYAGSFGGVDLGLSGFYVTGDAPFGPSDPEEWGLGANVGFGGFTLGGAYYQSEDLGFGISTPLPSTFGAEQEVWTLGVSYATGPWTVGLAYLQNENSVPGFKEKAKTWQTGGGYNLGSGVDIGLDLQMTDIDLGGGVEYDSKSAGLVLSVSF